MLLLSTAHCWLRAKLWPVNDSNTPDCYENRNEHSKNQINAPHTSCGSEDEKLFLYHGILCILTVLQSSVFMKPLNTSAYISLLSQLIPFKLESLQSVYYVFVKAQKSPWILTNSNFCLVLTSKPKDRFEKNIFDRNLKVDIYSCYKWQK